MLCSLVGLSKWGVPTSQLPRSPPIKEAIQIHQRTLEQLTDSVQRFGVSAVLAAQPATAEAKAEEEAPEEDEDEEDVRLDYISLHGTDTIVCSLCISVVLCLSLLSVSPSLALSSDTSNLSPCLLVSVTLPSDGLSKTFTKHSSICLSLSLSLSLALSRSLSLSLSLSLSCGKNSKMSLQDTKCCVKTSHPTRALSSLAECLNHPL